MDEVHASLSEVLPFGGSSGPCWPYPQPRPRRQGFSGQGIFNFFKIHEMGDNEFSAVEGGGSLILAWQIRNKRVLVVGGGEASLSQ